MREARVFLPYTKLHPRYIVDAEWRKVKEPVEVAAEAPGFSSHPRERIAGLHAGTFWMSDDFDDELPDSFWLGKS